MGRRLWPPLGPVERFASKVELTRYPSGQVGVSREPPKESLLQAFEALGTKKAVAAAYGVDRNTISRWLSRFQLTPESRPEVRHGNFVHEVLKSDSARIRVAQWVTDEGSVGVTYSPREDTTCLLVCGHMNDYEAISTISSILQTPCTGSVSRGPTTLPTLAVRMVSAKAYALLELLLPYMSGLKAMEAQAALAFFPRRGTIAGRHTSDEFLTGIWKSFALSSISHWNDARKKKITESEIKSLADSWVEGRIRRARRFIDSGAK